MLSSDFHCKENDALDSDIFGDIFLYQESKEPGKPHKSVYSPKTYIYTIESYATIHK